jgi:microcompartment protein CcmL/EutN
MAGTGRSSVSDPARAPGQAAGPESLAVLECETIHQGMETVDAMAKEARIEILAADPIPPGRFLILVAGPVGEVESSYRRGVEVAGTLHDRLFLPEVAAGVLPALRPGPREGEVDSLGIFESASVSACLDGADRGLKGAQVRLLQLHLARGIAGKAFGIFEGRQDMVEAALDLADAQARAHGRRVGITLLARPEAGLVRRILAAGWGFLEGSEIL